MSRRFLDDDNLSSHQNSSNNDISFGTNLLNSPSSFDSSMAVTIIILLTALFFVGFFSIYIRHISEENPTAERIRRRQQRRRLSFSVPSQSGLNPATVFALPMFAFEGSTKEEIDCVVCLTEFEEKETVKMIPNCKHLFHPKCIDLWLFSHSSCPLCRSTKLFPPTPPEVRLQGNVCLNMLGGERLIKQGFYGVGDSHAGSSVNRDCFEVRRQFGALPRCSSSCGCSSDGERIMLRRCSSV